MKTITVLAVQGGKEVPVPVQNLVRELLDAGYAVNLIGEYLQYLPEAITNSPFFFGYNLSEMCSRTALSKVIFRIKQHISVNRLVKKCMVNSDYLWTTSMRCISVLGKKVTKYKSILEFLELAPCGYYYKHYIKFDVGKIARKSWKNVVVEQNRAYIQQVWWDLPKRPYVLPNKPYNLDYGTITSELDEIIHRMKNETRKIILYLGVIYKDRDLESCAKAISCSDEYILYIAGKPTEAESEKLIDQLTKKYSVTYLGFFSPPQHLALVQYAHIGLLPYKPAKKTDNSVLNALYCAPNKIWEYAGFGVPMVGSDVMGLRAPFEKWNIGVCCNMNVENDILNAIKYVDQNHDEMSRNCLPFYNSVDLHKAVLEILEE